MPGKRCTVTDIFIVGAGGLGREVLDTVRQLPQYKILGFIDENLKMGTIVNGVEVVGRNDDLAKISGEVHAVLAVGSSVARRRIVTYFGDAVNWCSVVHPSVIVSPFATLGMGIVVQAYCIMAANSRIGDFVVMNAHSGVGHDAKIGEYTSVMSYCDVAGEASLGSDCFMGSGAKVLPSINVSNGAYLCAGSVVLRDVQQGVKVLGNPARVIG